MEKLKRAKSPLPAERKDGSKRQRVEGKQAQFPGAEAAQVAQQRMFEALPKESEIVIKHANIFVPTQDGEQELFKVNLPIDQIPVQVRETIGYKLNIEGQKSLFVFPEEVLHLERTQKTWLGQFEHDRALEFSATHAAIYCDLKAKGKFVTRSLHSKDLFHVFPSRQAINKKDASRQADQLDLRECFDVIIINDKLDLRQLKGRQLNRRDGSIVVATVRGATVAYQTVRFPE